MPYIETTASVPISGRKEQTIKERMGKAIELIGKTEGWLMLAFHGDTPMYFKGDGDEPCAICQVQLFGTVTEEGYAKLTEALTDILREELEIEADRIYVTYKEIDTWGWNSGNL